VPLVTPVIEDVIRQKTGKLPMRVDAANCGMDISGYEDRLGEDRVVCCAGAMAKYSPPFIVADLGTATTINVVSEDRTFLGGAIFTGIQTGLKALFKSTAQLPHADDFSDVILVGCDTRKGLVSGAVIGTACAIDGYAARIGEKVQISRNAVFKVIITGGNALLAAPYLTIDFIYEPTLLIEGLFEVYKNLKMPPLMDKYPQSLRKAL
jgi:type III pantothenate kinase